MEEKILINIPVDKSVEAVTKLIEVASKMPKKRQDKAIRFIIIIFVAYGRFMRGNSLW